MTISAEEFCLAWNSSNSIAEVVERTGMKYRAVNGRASYYRKKGIKLKSFLGLTSGRQVVDVDAINAALAKQESNDGT